MSKDDFLAGEIIHPEEALREDLKTTADKDQKTPSKIGNLARRLLRWATALSLIFLLGVLLAWLLRIRPATAELERLAGEVSGLQMEVDRLKGMEAEFEGLQSALARSEQHLAILKVLVDISSAQLAMVQDDPAGAKAALLGTDVKLAQLQASLSGEQAAAAAAMRDRLTLVLSEIDSDTFAADRDLEILANNLLALERSLFN